MSAPNSSESTAIEPAAGAECFVIMPISDHQDYPPGHFLRVYEDILAPACRNAGFRPVRADQVTATNMIHLDFLKRLLDAPLVLCDLSSRNPNVMFELGVRQAFDKPVVLVQDEQTPPIFDIAPLRYFKYHGARLYHEVVEDQARIAEAIRATRDAAEKKEGMNSLVRLLSLAAPAQVPVAPADKTDPRLQLILAEIQSLRSQMQRVVSTKLEAEPWKPSDMMRPSVPRSVQYLHADKETLELLLQSLAPSDQHLLVSYLAAPESMELRAASKTFNTSQDRISGFFTALGILIGDAQFRKAMHEHIAEGTHFSSFLSGD